MDSEVAHGFETLVWLPPCSGVIPARPSPTTSERLKSECTPDAKLWRVLSLHHGRSVGHEGDAGENMAYGDLHGEDRVDVDCTKDMN